MSYHRIRVRISPCSLLTRSAQGNSTCQSECILSSGSILSWLFMDPYHANARGLLNGHQATIAAKGHLTSTVRPTPVNVNCKGEITTRIKRCLRFGVTLLSHQMNLSSRLMNVNCHITENNSTHCISKNKQTNKQQQQKQQNCCKHT